MTDRRQPTSEQLLTAWFEDGPTRMPDRVVDVVADRIGRQSQRGAWRHPWRLPMNTQLKLLAGVAAVIVLAVAGYALLPKSAVGPATTPTPAPTATVQPSVSATASVTCDGDSTGCAGPLAAGTHTSAAFKPTLTFTVPDGWTNTMDIARSFTLHDNFAGGHFFQVLSQVAIPEQDATCSATRKAGVGNTVADWVTFLTKHPGLTTTAPKPVTLGGFSGQQLDVRVASTWTQRCPDSIAPAVMLITDSGAVPSRVRWIDDQNTRFRILDVGGETVILYLEAGGEVGALDARDSELKSVIDTFVFTP